MGLDMYLYLRKGDYKSSFRNPQQPLYPAELAEFEEEIGKINFASVSTETDYQIGYWRKFNALHSFIVNAFAGGIDNCEDIEIYREDIGEILFQLTAIKNEESAKENLPTSEGFFFGSTDYDDYYFQQVEYSIAIFQKAKKFLEEHPDYDLVYRASW